MERVFLPGGKPLCKAAIADQLFRFTSHQRIAFLWPAFASKFMCPQRLLRLEATVS
jgi:hypothetical protein